MILREYEICIGVDKKWNRKNFMFMLMGLYEFILLIWFYWLLNLGRKDFCGDDDWMVNVSVD